MFLKGGGAGKVNMKVMSVLNNSIQSIYLYQVPRCIL